MAAPTTTLESTESRYLPVLYPVGIVVVIVIALAVGAANLAEGWLREARPVTLATAFGGETVSRTLAGHELRVPVAWLADEDNGSVGFVTQVNFDLVLAIGEGKALETIGVTLLPRTKAQASSALLDGVYLHQFEDGLLTGPPGLVGKTLRDKSGLGGETVWYDAVSPRPFVAKCSSAIIAAEGQTCLRTALISPDIAAVFRFDYAVLDSWTEFDATVGPYLDAIGALTVN